MPTYQTRRTFLATIAGTTAAAWAEWVVDGDLGHEIGKKYSVYEGRWMRDQFALF